ncbi:MAG: hypothetical protein AB7S80_17470 [Rhizobiaceae bacterium]
MLGRFFACLVFAFSVLFGSTAAFACPPGTVFSAYKGNGLCLYEGQGLKTAAWCSQKFSASCPSGSKQKKKASDKNHVYCCPTEIVPKQCGLSCEPLKTAIKPKSEANRVHFNCIQGCLGNPYFACPDGRMIPNGASC